MESHRMRVGALAWNSSLLSSGSRDKSILHHDIRAQDDYISRLAGHKSEVIYFIHHYEFSDMSDSWIILLCSLLIYSYNMHILFPNTFQVCGLKWSYDNRQHASGGNDNRVRMHPWIVSWLDHWYYMEFKVAISYVHINVSFPALCMESTLGAPGTEVYWAYSSCQSYCVVTSSSWAACIWWRNCR